MALLKKSSTRAPEDLDKAETKEKTENIRKELIELQNLLYAESKHALLVIMQGPDASGKDGAIKKVFGGINPQGISVKSFKAPTQEELAHDFLWRIHHHVPQKGYIQLFNRSHYEDVLVTRVEGWCDDDMARKRFKAINNFEQMLQEQNNTHILKFYLHISPEEQRDRLKERREDPSKTWKYNPDDFDKAKQWDEYRAVYEDVFENCNNPAWTIVPADQNWYKEYLIAKSVCDKLKSLEMKYPSLKA
jgi:PPK2 family polyphosphate:nucleotide phosphotransferase